MSQPIPIPEAPETSDPHLLQVIRDRIRQRGPIPFAEFMRLALYHPEGGYYASSYDPVGWKDGADYYTAPSRHPVFGAVLATQVAECLAAVGEGPLDLVEFGPGSGALAQSLLRGLSAPASGHLAGLRCTLVESNPHRVGVQRRRLSEAGLAENVRWMDLSAGEGASERLRGCLIANEVLDALPVHRLVFQEGSFKEIHVDWKEGLVETLRPISSPALLAELQRHTFGPREGQEVEVGLEAIRWIRRVASGLGRGYLFLFDYGHVAPEIYAPRHQRGTLLAYHRHRTNEDYLERVGRQDLTAHVNFSSVIAAAREAGLACCGLVPQGRFLLALGILNRLRPASTEFSWEEYQERKAIEVLFLPAGMGESHQVLILATQGVERDLACLRPPEEWETPGGERHERIGGMREG